MQERHLYWTLIFFLGPAEAPYFFHSRIAIALPLCPFKREQRGRRCLFITVSLAISWFIKTNLKNFIVAIRSTRIFRMVFYNFCYYFWGQRCWGIETNMIGNVFFVFYKFPLPSALLLLPCPTAAPASMKIYAVSTNFPKTLVCSKREYEVILWRHKQRIFSIKNTISYCSILEFRMGHPIKQPLKRTEWFLTHFPKHNCATPIRTNVEGNKRFRSSQLSMVTNSRFPKTNRAKKPEPLENS